MSDEQLALGIYLAGSFETQLHQNIMAEWLVEKVAKDYPLVITSTWHVNGVEENLHKRAAIDYGDLSAAHCILASFPYGFGTSSELGFALGTNKHIVYFKPEAYEDDELLPTGFNKDWKSSALPQDGSPVHVTVSKTEHLIKVIKLIQILENSKYQEKKSGLANNIRPSIFGSESGSVR